MMPARYAHVALDETSGTCASVQGSEPHPELVASSSDSSQWQGGWWVGNGLDRCLQYAFDIDPEAGVYLPAEGVCLFAVAVELSQVASTDEHVLAVGYVDDLLDFHGVSITVNPAGKVAWELHDNATPAVGRGPITTSSALALDIPFGICCFVDNRTDGANTAAIYRFALGTTLVETGSIRELSALGSVTAEPIDGRRRIQIGCRYNHAEEPEGWFSGRLRRLSVFNFDENPIPNIHELMGALSKGHMAITDEVLRIAGIPSGAVQVQFVKVEG